MQLKKSLLSVILLIVVVAVIVMIANRTYLIRVYEAKSIDSVRDADWYQPTSLFTASKKPIYLERSSTNSNFHTQGFKHALDYAQQLDSSALLVWHKGGMLLEKYWGESSEDSYVQTFSIHKSIVALAIGAAIQDGRIGSVQDPVSQYIGQWIEQPLGQITIEHLLTMSSGLERPAQSNELFSHSTLMLYGTDTSAQARALTQVSQPGTVFDYNNANPQLLIDVLEAATGASYADYLSQQLWSKVAASEGYVWLDKTQGTAKGFCCIISKPDDLLRLGILFSMQGHWNDEAVVAKSWLEASTTPSNANPNYGYLTWLGSPHHQMRTYNPGSVFGVLHSVPYIADDLIFFDGFGGQRVYIVPSKELVIVRTGSIRFDFDDAFLPNAIISAIDKAETDPAAAEKLTVEYADVSIQAQHAETIPLRISYPREVTGNYPLIIFSHGHFLTNDAYHPLTDKWVEQGYVVVAPQHIDTGDMASVQKLTEKVGHDWIAASRVLDMKAAIDQIQSVVPQLNNFKGKVLSDKVIAAGHSLGALSAQLLAGASQEKKGDSLYPIPSRISDDRVAAVVAVSPPGLMPDYLTQKTWQDFSTPQLVITGTQDTFEYIWTDYQEHLVSYETAKPGDNYLLVLDGVDHYFGNLIGRPERKKSPQTEALKSAGNISLAFMQNYVQDNIQDSDLSQLLLANNQAAVLRFEHR